MVVSTIRLMGIRPKPRETPPVVARLSQNCWLSNTSENHPVEVFNYGSEAFFR